MAPTPPLGPAPPMDEVDAAGAPDDPPAGAAGVGAGMFCIRWQTGSHGSVGRQTVRSFFYIHLFFCSIYITFSNIIVPFDLFLVFLFYFLSWKVSKMNPPEF